MRALPLLLVLLACAPTAPTDPKEGHVLAETGRFAALLRVDVHAEVTDRVHTVTCMDGTRCPAAGWYQDGRIEYYRPVILERDMAYGTALAAHEVCHAISIQHDPRHQACVDRMAS